MTSLDSERTDVDTEAFRSLCAEARDLIKRLEGSSVQSVAVEAGGARIEIERALPGRAAPPPVAAGAQAQVAAPAQAGATMAMGPATGPGIAPEARSASGSFAAIAAEQDRRVAVLAPLVGTFYRASQPGAKPFVEEGATVGVGDTVGIVEAMKLMNEVASAEAGRVVEIAVENGERVEFEQVLMYLEPSDDE